MLVATAGGVDCRFSEASAWTVWLTHTLGASKANRVAIFANNITRDPRGVDRVERNARSRFAERVEPE